LITFIVRFKRNKIIGEKRWGIFFVFLITSRQRRVLPEAPCGKRAGTPMAPEQRATPALLPENRMVDTAR
jgi:hypothetical protein